MQHASDVILLQDKDGKIVYESLSASRIFGYPQGFFLGKGKADLEESELWKLVPSADIKDLGQLLQRMKENRDGGLLYHVRFRHAAGNWLDLEVLATNLLHQPDVEGILITIRDVSERRRAEQIQKQLEGQLRQAQKMEALGTLAGGIAHDFNNILGAIVGFTWLARSDLQSSKVVAESLEQISQASDRAIGLVKQILTFSRQGKQERMKTILQPVIQECLKLLRSTLPAAIEIRSEIAAEPLTVMADPTLIHQVMMNLCTNAAHAMMQNPGILLVALQCLSWKEESESPSPGLGPGAYALITVRDTGHGMDESTLKRIFDPFFTTKAPGEGTGLGLAVVHGIVKDHRGGLEVTSEPGVGTVFRIYLPLVETIGTTGEKHSPQICPGRGENILYVDDETALCRSHRVVLQKIGYEVTAFSSPVEVLSHLRTDSKAYDLVMTDFNMPGMSGLELAVEIGKINPDLPIILVSGHLGTTTREMALKSGIREVLVKPLLPQEVSVVLDRILHTLPSRETES
jgi:PAS domain S-box-containing protein